MARSTHLELLCCTASHLCLISARLQSGPAHAGVETDGPGVTREPTLLKCLLQQRHWQKYGTFCVEYDNAARIVSPDLVGTWPSRAQLHRWLSGTIKSLPYPDHCRILERMFPGWTAEQLLSPRSDDQDATLSGIAASHTETTPGTAAPPTLDVSAVFCSR